MEQAETRERERKRRWIFFMIPLFLFLLLAVILLLFSDQWGLSFAIFENASQSNATEMASASPTPQSYYYLKLDYCDATSISMIRDSISRRQHPGDSPPSTEESFVSLSLPPFQSESSGKLSIFASMQVEGTSLSLSTPFTSVCIEVPSLSRDDSSQRSLTMTSSWIAIDASGLGKGWHVNITATDFLDDSGNRIPIEACQLEFTDDDITLIDGNQKPSSMIPSPVPLSNVERKIASALPGEGMGSYLLEPSFTLMIPSDTPEGIYSSIISLTIVAGP
jgi:hypothetical protein